MEDFAIISKEFSDSVNKILEENSKTYNLKHPESLRFLLEITKRGIDCIDAVNILQKNISLKTTFENTIGIALRSSLLDAIILIYCDTEISKVSPDNYFSEFEGIISKFSFDHLNHLSNEYGDINEIKHLITRDSKGRIKSIFGDAPSTKSLINKLSNKDYYYKDLCSNWEFYSKYEHYGALTYFLLRQEYSINFRRQVMALSQIMFMILVALKISRAISTQVSITDIDYDNLRNLWLKYIDNILKLNKTITH